MTSSVAIRVEGLGKRYRIGQRQGGYRTLRETVAQSLTAPIHTVRSAVSRSRWGRPQGESEFWALRDVAFEIEQGEIVGIIGRNGAGKSTLLKILARITEPSEGEAELRGRIGSLLEVGTGFHPELTGRENISLNGAILGMSRKRINTIYDDIVSFAEVEKFVDTPVKHYSSGMYLRLAFAVAAHLEPEILLVDEVLAVGDAAFQKKCLGKMGEVASEGRTVLFVSHNTASIQALCTRGIFLRHGQVAAHDTASEVVSAYLKSLEQSASQDLPSRSERKGKGAVQLCDVEIATSDSASGTLATGRPVRFLFRLSSTGAGMVVVFTIYDQEGLPISTFNSAVPSPEDVHGSGGDPTFACEMPELLLVPGRYRINVSVSADGELQDHVEGAAFFDVEPGTVGGRPVFRDNGHGRVRLPHRWTLA